MSQPVREALQTQLARSRQTGPDDLVFTTRNQTPLNPKNLLRRVLQPTCKSLGLPLISWHSFRHTHATQLAEVGESLRTAQGLLGHSDLETTLNVHTHAIPEPQRRAVDKIAEVLFTSVHEISAATENGNVNYPFHDKTIVVARCGRICLGHKKINFSTVFAGQAVGIKEVHDDIWLVSLMDYDLGYFDLETRVLEPLENPFGPKVLPM